MNGENQAPAVDAGRRTYLMKYIRKIPWKEVCKFLSGAFFVNSGVLFYLYLTGVSVPFFGFTETPEISGIRSIVHFVLFLITFYLGFIRK